MTFARVRIQNLNAAMRQPSMRQPSKGNNIVRTKVRTRVCPHVVQLHGGQYSSYRSNNNNNNDTVVLSLPLAIIMALPLALAAAGSVTIL